jgi:hypothetical protein
MTLLAPVPPWMFEICQVVGGKKALPSSQTVCREFGDGRCGQMDRVLRQMRVGDVSLNALDGQLPGERAAAAVLDHVAEGVDRRRFADDAVVDRLAAALQGVGDGDGAVGGVAFLIGSEQEGDRTAMRGMCGDEGFARRDEGGQRAFMSAAPRP